MKISHKFDLFVKFYVSCLWFKTLHTLKTMQIVIGRHLDTMVSIPSCVKYFIIRNVSLPNVKELWSHCWIKYARFENFWQNVVLCCILNQSLLYLISFHHVKIFCLIFSIGIFLTFCNRLWFFRLFDFFLFSHLFFQCVQEM